MRRLTIKRRRLWTLRRDLGQKKLCAPHHKQGTQQTRKSYFHGRRWWRCSTMLHMAEPSWGLNFASDGRFIHPIHLSFPQLGISVWVKFGYRQSLIMLCWNDERMLLSLFSIRTKSSHLIRFGQISTNTASGLKLWRSFGDHYFGSARGTALFFVQLHREN